MLRFLKQQKASILLMLTASFFLTNCKEEEYNYELVQKEVNINIADYRLKKQTECRQAMLKKASEIVDSLLLLNADLWQASNDSLNRPIKPPKPSLPTLQKVRDSSTIAPLFEVQRKKKQLEDIN